MKLKITEAERKLVVSGLFLAAEWEDSLAANEFTGSPEWKAAKKRATKYRVLKNKIFASDLLK